MFNQLIFLSGTCLDVQQYRVAFIANSAELLVPLPELIQRCHILPTVSVI